jgi:nucleoside phosphorylase
MFRDRRTIAVNSALSPDYQSLVHGIAVQNQLTVAEYYRVPEGLLITLESTPANGGNQGRFAKASDAAFIAIQDALTSKQPVRRRKKNRRFPKKPIDSDLKYDAKKQPWYPSPIASITELPSAEFTQIRILVDAVLMTATEPELKATLALLKPLPGRTNLLRVNSPKATYHVGRYGAVNVALGMCAMGSVGRDSSIIETTRAILIWEPKAVVMVGIAFGMRPRKQELGDVLVSEKVTPYEPQRRGKNPISRGVPVRAGKTLLARFRARQGWHFVKPDGVASECWIGEIVSGEKLVDDNQFKKQLLTSAPEAIGGEMEGAGLIAAAEDLGVEWILVKGICDWADGKKTSKHQELAAAAAASLVHHLFQDSTVLEGLEKPKIALLPPIPSSIKFGSIDRAKATPSVENRHGRRKRAFGSSPPLERPQSTQRPKVVEERVEPTVFFNERTCDAFPGVRGVKEYDNPKEAIERLSDLLKEPLRPGGQYPIWAMDAMGSRPIDGFKQLGSECVKIGIARFRVERLWAYRSRAYWRDFVLLKFKADDPTGLHPVAAQSEIDERVKELGTHTEEYGVLDNEIITLAEHDDGAVIRNGRSKPTQGFEHEVRHLTRGAVVIASQFSPLHAKNPHDFERVHVSFIRRFIEGKATANDLVKLVETLPKHPQDD